MGNGNVCSFNVAATLSAYCGVYLNGTANTVGYPTTTASQPIGVLTDVVLDTNQAIPVQVDGIADLLFNDSVASGELVALDSSGRGVPSVALTASVTYVIGRLIGAKVNTTGTVAKILVMPQPVGKLV